MENIILEAKIRKRVSKKIKTEYMPLKPGEVWWTSINGEGITIQANIYNTSTMYVGVAK